jgi:predicted O-methyltransferase YrrM
LTLVDLTLATGASGRGLAAIVNVLTGIELLARDDAGQFSLTPESAAFLVSDQPGFVGGVFRHVSAQLLPKWLHLSDIVGGHRPTGDTSAGDEDAAFFAEFVEEIFPLSYPAARVLGAVLNVAGADAPLSVLDLGAGAGVWGIALAQASRHVTVRAVDWPQVLPATRRMFDRFGLADRLTAVGGDLFEADLGTAHQVAVIGHILHSEGADRCRTLLRRTRAALAPGGTVAIAEFLVNADRRGPMNALIFAVNMLVNTEAGGTYTFEEIACWLAETGFADARQVPAPGPSPLILATAAG